MHQIFLVILQQCIEDPIENIACMAHDAALGASQIGLISQEEILISAVLEVANLIQSVASSARNSFYTMYYNLPFINTSNSSLCLIQKRGICGNHQELFVKTLKYLKIPTRIISVYYLDNGQR